MGKISIEAAAAVMKKNKFTGAILDFVLRVQKRRNENSEKYRMTNILLSLFFPVFIVCMAEMNQCKYPSKFIIFVSQRPSVMLFNVLIAALIFIALFMLLKRAWLAMTGQSILYMILSISELFKYNTNGNHLTVSDLSLVKSLESLMSFAYVRITVMLGIYVAVILVYLGAAFWFNPKVNVRFYKAALTAVLSAGACAAVMFVPAVGNKVYAAFDIDTDVSKNTFILNEKFQNNGFLAFFMQDSTETVENALKEPEQYDKAAVDAYVGDEEETGSAESSVKPNVIVVMSESYADFRVFDDKLDIDEDVYKGFDAVCNDENALGGTAIVPTYASYTCRTEFELMFGLPVKSLADPNMPQRLLPDRKQATAVSYFKAGGYNTYYVHPYLGTFYGRNHIYSNYSFDKLIFEDDFDIQPEYYGNYIDDASVFDEIKYLIENSDEPVYTHATTMQNHQPYGGETSQEQFESYLSEIQHTSECLEEFTKELKDINEPTIVFYIGDHFPSLRGDDSVYANLGITSANCSTIYEQHYALWANYEADFSAVPEENFSTFYMPYILMKTAGVRGDAFTEEMLDRLESLPVYSTNYQPDSISDEELDLLAYDRILGDQLSPNVLAELYPEEVTETVKGD